MYQRFYTAIHYLEIYPKEKAGQVCKDVSLSMITLIINNNKILIVKTGNNLDVHS
jgi:hypothetical protein